MVQKLINVNPQVVSGTPVFYGTRVPVQALLDYIEGGHTIDDFLEGFPSVTRGQAVAVIQEGVRLLTEASAVANSAR